MSDPLRHYREIWLADFEFRAPPGERPQPLCLVAREFRSGRTIKLWAGDLAAEFLPPFPIGADALVVAYYASAEIGCFKALGWPTPARILDLFCEFRYLTNGLPTACGNGLLGALAHFGIDGINAADKSEMRELALHGEPYTDGEKTALIDYCESDVIALAKLLPAMLPQVDLPPAFLRGRYMAAAAAIEYNGVPIDVELLERIKANWGDLKRQLVRIVNDDFGVYVPTARTINPDTPLGDAIHATAEAWRVDPFALAENLDQVFQEEVQARGDRETALSSARRTTGINSRTAWAWEDSGQDYSS